MEWTDKIDGADNVNAADVNVLAAELIEHAKNLSKVQAYYGKKYLTKRGKVFEDFLTPSEWTRNDTGTCTIAANTTEVKRGKQSLKGTVTTAAGECKITKTVSKCMTGTNKILRLSLYLHNPVAEYGYISIYLADDNFSNFQLFELDKTKLVQGWNYVAIYPTDNWQATGTPTLDMVITRLRFAFNGATGKTPSITFDSLDYDCENEPRVVFTFDDANTNILTKAFPVLQTYGFVGTVYVIPSTVGTTGVMTKANLDTLYAAGWDIANHTYNHLDLTELTQAEIEAEITTAKDWLIANGYSRSPLHLAMPHGDYDADVAAAITATGCLTARSTSGDAFYPQAKEPTYLPAYYVLLETTLAAAIATIEDAVAKGQSLIFLFHNILDTATGTYEWSTANFEAVVKLIYDLNVPVVPTSQWYEGL